MATKTLTIVFDGRLLKGSITDFHQIEISLGRITNSTIMYGTNPQALFNDPHLWNANKYNRFSGQLSDINIWSKPISFDNLVLFTKECQSTKALGLQPDLLDWSKTIINNKSTEFVNIQKTQREDSICSTGHGDELKLMHYQSSHTEATHLCQAYGGKLIAPTNDSELEVIKEELFNKINIVGHQRDKFKVWTGIIMSPNDSWVRAYDNVEAIFPWVQGQPNGLDLQQCLAGMVVKAKHTLDFMDEHCLDNHYALCQVPLTLKFKLRGELPELLGVERDFSSHASDDTGQEWDSFQGYTNHKIERINNQWALVQVQDSTDKVLAILQANNVLGLKNWTYNNESYEMKLSQVSFSLWKYVFHSKYSPF
jgi:hypothetical protein